MPLAPPLELIDHLEGTDYDFLSLEGWIFKGDRAQALRTVGLMIDDNWIVAELDGQPVPEWLWQDWRRNPTLPETEQSLVRLKLYLGQSYRSWVRSGKPVT